MISATDQLKFVHPAESAPIDSLCVVSDNQRLFLVTSRLLFLANFPAQYLQTNEVSCATAVHGLVNELLTPLVVVVFEIVFAHDQNILIFH